MKAIYEITFHSKVGQHISDTCLICREASAKGFQSAMTWALNTAEAHEYPASIQQLTAATHD